jgi:hypothetical protein
MSAKPAIPNTRTGDARTDLALAAMKQTLDQITGQARNAVRLDPLPSTATTADIIDRLNAITERLQ